jgi:ABC-type glycerol-3-phosphate transport system substrate-binding protein
MKLRKAVAVTAVLAFGAAGLAACSSSNEGGGTQTSGTATTTAAETSSAAETTAAGGTDTGSLTVWENNTTGKGPAFWDQVVADYKKVQPGVTVNIVPVQNEDLDGKLQTALNGGDAPDVFLQRGGGKLQDMVDAGFVKDVTDVVQATDIPKSVWAPDTAKDGKIYAVAMTVLPGGLWYSKDLFSQAGITTPPTTLDEFDTAVQKLKDANITPIGLGGKDAWPAAHWYYWFALRECTTDAISTAASDQKLDDPCFLKAGEDLQTFAGTKPFNSDFLTTSAQQGASSSAGLLANHKVAMELMGAWEPGVVGSLTPDQQNLPDLGFFPFPSVSGGAGEEGAVMAGVDAFSCSSQAPEPTCTNFLAFLATKEIQEAYSEAASAPPASAAATAAVTDESLKSAIEAFQNAPFVSLWLDTLLGQNIGNALNTGVVDMLSGKGSPQGIIDAANTAAAKG